MPDISTARWHMEVSNIYSSGEPLGNDLKHIAHNISPYVYQRGGRIYSDLMWEISSKTPKLRQFVLTTSDYCKLYVTVVSFHIRRDASTLPIYCGEEFVHVPISVGLISRLPYLTFPKIFLSHFYHAFAGSSCLVPSDIAGAIGQVMHGIPVPQGPQSLVIWNLPPLPGANGTVPLYMGDVGVSGAPMEETLPIQSTFSRSFTEVDLVALFDVLSVEVILSVVNALLLEQKVLLVSSKFPASFIAHLCEAVRLLLYPFDWQHVYIPLIPSVNFDGPVGDPTDDDSPAVFPPYWLGSAVSNEHIHPLRFLDVPAPLFGGVKIRSSTHSLNEIFSKRYPDLNLVDLDNDVMFPATDRIDGEDTPLPQFPRKLSQLILARLGPIMEKFCPHSNRPLIGACKDRMERYMNWDRIVPSEVFSVESTSQGNPSRRNSLNSSIVASGIHRRRSSIALKSSSSFRSAVSRTHRSGTWLGGFASLFRPSAAPRGSSSSRASSTERLAEGEAPSTPPLPGSKDDSNFELHATEIIQSVFVESFVRIFFAYRDFLLVAAKVDVVDSMPDSPDTEPLASSASTSQLFIGGDRNFQGRQFLKCIERQGVFGTDSLNFIRTFITSTQCWDIFVRTTALNATAKFFDTACEYYCSINKVEYMKFKQMNLSIILQSGQRFADLPPGVVTECDRLGPCPVTRKSREYFFDQLMSLIRRKRNSIDCVTVSNLAPARHGVVSVSDNDGPDKGETLNTILKLKLALGYNTDANLEAIKFFQSPVPYEEFLHAFIEAIPVAIGQKDGHHHLLNVLLGSKPLLSTADTQNSKTTMEIPPSPSASSNRQQALWRSPGGFFRGISTFISIGDELNGGRKILGGIPKSALLLPVPAAPPFLLRNVNSDLDFRIIHVVNGVGNIDSSCWHCGCFEPLDSILGRGGFWTAQHDNSLTVDCINCQSNVHVTLYPSQVYHHGVHLRPLHAILESVLELPLEFSNYINLLFLMGTFIEIYTCAVDGRRNLRGIVSLLDVMRDFVTSIASPVFGGDIPDPVVAPDDSTRQVEIVDEQKIPDTPKSRAIWRIRQYRAKLDLTAKAVTANPKRSPTIRSRPQSTIIRINVDESLSPRTPPPQGDPSGSFRRRIPTRKSSPGELGPSVSPVNSSPNRSPPVPPSERRPLGSAPRRLSSRKSTSGQ